jgi:hypothetical protein
MLKNLKMTVLVAKDPIPSVSRKFVPNPVARWETEGKAGPSGRARAKSCPKITK